MAVNQKAAELAEKVEEKLTKELRNELNEFKSNEINAMDEFLNEITNNIIDENKIEINETFEMNKNEILVKEIKSVFDRYDVTLSESEANVVGGLKKEYEDLKFPSSVQYFNNRDTERGLHPTQKPVGLFEYLIRTYTNENDLVFDGFGGSGTTAIAAYRSKRNFIVVEKEPKYFELSQKRLAEEVKQCRLF